MTVSVILQCAGIVDMFQLLPVTHVLMICNVIYTFVLIHYEARVEENESVREFTYPYILCWDLALRSLFYTMQDILRLHPYSFLLEQWDLLLP